MNLKVRLAALFRFGGKVSKFLVVERVLGVVTRSVDAVMIYFIWTDPKFGPVKAFLIGTPMNFALCSMVIYLNNIFLRRGLDVTGLEELREMTATEYQHNQRVKRLVSWVLRRRGSIFWVGSWFYLDPDYVTLLLQDPKKSMWDNLRTITVPSVVLAMVVWTIIYWATYEGFQLARWFAS